MPDVFTVFLNKDDDDDDDDDDDTVKDVISFTCEYINDVTFINVFS